ncbi:MAG: single-stranded-DNA-specific exonuclease RecJ [Lactovum sp.]
MIQAKYKWNLLDSEPTADFLKETKKLKLNQILSKLLWERGLGKSDEINQFLKVSTEYLHDPFLLHDMEKSILRIRQAIEKQEKILIYGDYDADGMTAASIMKSALDELGADEFTQVYLPNRFTDGYGPNLDVYKYWIEKEEITLIITVDNGVSGHEAIRWAQENRCDVIVSDHHGLPAELPQAYSIIHPKHPEASYPFDDLCGAGVAFKIATALLDYLPMEMLDLVAIGTIADMVSLRDENRCLVTLGLEQLKNTDRIGLLQLIKLAGVELETLTEESVAFQIAPRLNALGRLDDPNPAVELLIGWEEEITEEIAQNIDRLNQERRAIVERIFSEAEKMLDENSIVQVLYHPDWHKGVLGIVAGRLLEKTGQPIIMLQHDLETNELRGSGRSISSFNIFEVMDAHRELFIAVGGHAQACGLTISLKNVEELKKVLSDEIKKQEIDLSEKVQKEVAMELSLDEIDLDLLKSISKLAPFGMDNPKPCFLIKDYQVTQTRQMGSENKHLKLKLEKDKTQIDAIYFSHGKEAFEFEQLQTELLVNLSVNSWNGKSSVQLMVEDACFTGVGLLDLRGKSLNLPENISIFEKNLFKNGIINSVLLIQDVPTGKEAYLALQKVIKEHDFQMIYFKNQLTQNYYLAGPGTREQFAQLYKLLAEYTEFDVRYKLKDLSKYLSIPILLLTKMIQIFEELGFVTIEEGIMRPVKGATRREISESLIYQELLELIKCQKLFALSPVRDIYYQLKNGD